MGMMRLKLSMLEPTSCRHTQAELHKPGVALSEFQCIALFGQIGVKLSTSCRKQCMLAGNFAGTLTPLLDEIKLDFLELGY